MNIINNGFSNSKVFDISFLGLGADGHSASLFPESCPARFSPEWFSTVLQTRSNNFKSEGLTIGPELIARSRKLILVVTGEEKAEVFKKIIAQLKTGCVHTDSNQVFPSVKIIRRRNELGMRSLVLCDEVFSVNIERRG